MITPSDGNSWRIFSSFRLIIPRTKPGLHPRCRSICRHCRLPARTKYRVPETGPVTAAPGLSMQFPALDAFCRSDADRLFCVFSLSLSFLTCLLCFLLPAFLLSAEQNPVEYPKQHITCHSSKCIQKHIIHIT